MANIANLTVSLSANSAKLNKGFKKAHKRSKRFSNKMNKTFKRVGASIAAAFTVGAYAGKQLAESMDEIIKKARSLSLTAEAWQGLSFAFEQSGIDAGTAAKAVFNLQKQIGKAARGEKIYVDALRSIGLSYDQLKDKSPDEQFALVIDGLKGIKDPALRAAIANDLLGRSAKDMGTLMLTGSMGISELIAQAKEYGIIISTKALKASEGLNDAINILSLTFRAKLSEALGKVAPQIERFVLAFAKFINEIWPQLGVVFPALGEMLLGVATAFGVMWLAAFGPIGAGIVIAAAAVYAFADNTKSVLGQVVGFFYKAFLDLKTIIMTVVPESLGALILILESMFLDIQGVIVNSLKAITEAASKYLPDFLVPDWVKDANESLDGLSKEIEERQKAIAQSVTEAGKTITDEFAQNAKDANDLVDAFTKIEQAFIKITDFKLPEKPTGDGGKGGNTGGTGSGTPFDPNARTYDDIRNSFAKSVSDGIISGFQEGGVKGALKSFAQSVATALNDRASEALADALFGVKGGTSKGLIGGFIGDIFGVNSGGIVGDGTVHKFSNGGVVPGSGNTDSVLAALTPGEIVLNPARGQGMGGDTYNITIDAIDTQSFNDRLARDPKMVSQIAEVGKRSTQGIRR